MDNVVLLFIFLAVFICVRGEENVALGQNTSQSSNYLQSFSSLAVDGNTNNVHGPGSCSHTNNIGTNWWCVDLQRAVDFHNIKIYNRNTHQQRLQGFEIRLSSNGECNDNGYQQSTVCYKDTSTTTQDIYTIEQCNQQNTGQFNGRSVYISVENPENSDKYLTLCEVEIFEKCPGNCKDSCNTKGVCKSCITGYYGDKCDEYCPTDCKDGCQKNNGNCNGCKQGYWGTQCQAICGNCNNGCQSNGTCNGGCKRGFWGLRCQDNCNKCNHGCQQDNGNCNSGGCMSGYYGDTCDKFCPTNCNNGCQQDNGNCNSGGCMSGYYGDKCDKFCPTNCNNGCQQDNGDCNSGGCMSGYHGEKCDKFCPTNCNNGCRQYNGYCTSYPGSPDGISQLASGIIGALSLIVIILLMVIFYCSYKRRIDRDKLNERPVRYTSGNEETVITPQNEVNEPPYYSNLPHDISSSPYYNLQQVGDTSRVEANSYDSLDRTVPSSTYETLQ